MRALIVVACTLALAAPAWAQEGDSDTLRNSVQVLAGAGFGGFTSNLGDNSSVGVAWMARAGVNFQKFFGAELNYQGASSAANTGDSHVTENQLTGNVKAGYPFMVADRVLQPYGFVGLGYGHIGVDSTLAPMGLTSENAAVFPIGAGVSYSVTPIFLVDARYTYNALTETLGNTWNVAFNVGAHFGQ